MGEVVANTPKVAKVAAASFPKMLREQKSFIQAEAMPLIKNSWWDTPGGFIAVPKPGQPKKNQKHPKNSRVAVVCTVNLQKDLHVQWHLLWNLG